MTDYQLTPNEERVAIMAIERFINDRVARAHEERITPHKQILEEQISAAEAVLKKIETVRAEP